MEDKDLYNRLLESVEALSLEPTEKVMVASIADQRICLFVHGKSCKDYRMSSSKRPPSCLEDSLGTPWGLHEVCEKIGENAPLGMVFKGRKPIGLRYWECSEDDRRKNLITSRILRLRGMEPGLNAGTGCDTFDRYVYMHGTNHETAIGRPASSGCLQLNNKDVLELFELVDPGTLLLILKD